MSEGHGRLGSVVEVVQKQVIDISAQGACDPKDRVKHIFDLLADICLMVLAWWKKTLVYLM